MRTDRKDCAGRRTQVGRLVSLSLYLLTEVALLVLFTVLDSQDRIGAANLHKFISIAFNTLSLFLFILTCRLRPRDGRSLSGQPALLAGGLLVTLGADVFLILLDSHYLLGVLLFCLVESLYALFLLPEKEDSVGSVYARSAAFLLFLRVGLWAIILIILKVWDLLDALTAASLFSMTQLTLNVLFGWKHFSHRRTVSALLLALGLTLFWCCDACVGLRNIASYLPAVPRFVPNIAGSAIWLFYLPSQVLIFLSYVRSCLSSRRLS